MNEEQAAAKAWVEEAARRHVGDDVTWSVVETPYGELRVEMQASGREPFIGPAFDAAEVRISREPERRIERVLKGWADQARGLTEP